MAAGVVFRVAGGFGAAFFGAAVFVAAVFVAAVFVAAVFVAAVFVAADFGAAVLVAADLGVVFAATVFVGADFGVVAEVVVFAAPLAGFAAPDFAVVVPGVAAFDVPVFVATGVFRAGALTAVDASAVASPVSAAGVRGVVFLAAALRGAAGLSPDAVAPGAVFARDAADFGFAPVVLGDVADAGFGEGAGTVDGCPTRDASCICWSGASWEESGSGVTGPTYQEPIRYSRLRPI